MNPIPEKLVAYNVYNEGETLIGLDAEATLPDFESVTNEVAGPGILGSVDSPTPGHFGSMTFSLTFRTVSKAAAHLYEPGAHTLTLRADQSSYDEGAGKENHRPLKVVVRGRPKKLTGGKAKAGESTGTSIDLEITYIKITERDDVLLELDKYNYIFIVNNVDYMAEVRNNI